MTRRDSLVTIKVPTAISGISRAQYKRFYRSTRLTPHINLIDTGQAEFDYNLQPVSSFLVDPTQERWSMWLVETRVFPWVYWHRVLKGRLHESRVMKPLAPLVRWFGLALKES